MRDFDIRNILRNTLLNKYYGDKTSRVVEELDIPTARARIDMAVINGYMHGFEIKSANDTLNRIPTQIEAYTKVFDFLSVVTEVKYEQKLIKLLPDWVSIYTCNIDGEINLIQKGGRNCQKNAFNIAKLLWRQELITILNDHGIKYRKSDRNWLLCEALSNNVEIEKLAKLVREIMKQRLDWKLKQTI